MRAAVRAVDAAAVRDALHRLEPSATLEGADGTGRTALHVCAAAAAEEDAAEIVALLVGCSASVAARDVEGRTPLRLAVSAALATAGDDARYEAAERTVRALLLRGASPAEWSRDGCDLAGRLGEVAGRRISEALLDAGADLPWHPASLRGAAVAADACGVQRALGRLRDSASALDARSEAGRTVLHDCVARPRPGAAECVRLLAEASSSLDARDAEGHAPLQLAVRVAATEQGDMAVGVAQALLECGASADVDEWRSGDCALARHSGPLVELLQDAGADLPWHLRSLRATALACDIDGVRAAIARLASPAVALQARDASGATVLQSLCAGGAARSGAAAVAALLLASSAEPCLDGDGRSPLALAVDCCLAAEAVEERQNALETVSALLDGGADAEPTWRNFGDVLAAPEASALAALLLDHGADLPWHPESLQEAVLGGCGAEAVRVAIDRLRPRCVDVVNRPLDNASTTLLHVAARARHGEAAQVVELLLRSAADQEAVDASGMTPLEVATGVAIECAEPNALASVRVLVSMGAPTAVLQCWRNERGALARAAFAGAAGEVPAALVDCGVDLPWFPHIADLRRKCLEYRVPIDRMDSGVAARIVAECDEWRALPVKSLRQECRARILPTDDCVERGDLVARLRAARVLQACEAREQPERKLVGKWCYGSKLVEYLVLRTDDGLLRFEGPHSTCGTLIGVLEVRNDEEGEVGDPFGREGEGPWHIARLTAAASGVEVGHIRLRYSDQEMTMRSNFKSETMADWGRDIVARKVMDASEVIAATASTSSASLGGHGQRPEDPPAPAAAAERDPVGKTAASEDVDDEDPPAPAATAKVEVAEDIDSTDDLPMAFMAAVDRHDVDAVKRGLARARREGGEDEAEGLVCTFDADANTMLHRCAAGAAAASGGTEVARLLLEAKAEVNDRNLLGETPLLVAVRAAGDPAEALVRLLLEASAEPGHADALSGETALMEAACRGELGISRLLLEAGADPAQKNSHGLTARDLAAEGGQRRVADLLRAAQACPAGVDPEILVRARPLWAAVEACKADEARECLRSLGLDGAEAAARTTTGLRGGGRTLLHVCAAFAGNAEAEGIATALLEAGARVDVRDAEGRRPLALAVEAALAAGMSDTGGSGAWAAELGTVRALLAAGAPPEIDESEDPTSAFASSLSSPLGAALCDLLRAFGADLPQEACDDNSAATAEPAQEKQIDEEDVPAPDDGTGPDADLRELCAQLDIPFEVLGAEGARALARDCAGWREMSLKELRAACRLEELPTADLIEKSEFVGRLKQVRIWQEMTQEALREECLARGASVAFDFASRRDMENALRAQAGLPIIGDRRLQSQCKERGIPVHLLSAEAAEEALAVAKRLEGSKISELKQVYAQWGLALEVGLEKADMIRNLTEILIWQHLPLEELYRLCRQKGVQFSGAARDEIVSKLVASTWPTAAPMVSRYKNFFDYGGASHQQQPQGKPQPEQQRPPRPQAGPTEDWEARAAWNRAQFQNGNRNHPGMPTGSRRWAAGGKGVPLQGSGRPRPPPPPKLPNVDRHLQLLGLPPSATQNEVRKAYRKLALKYHPDKNPGKSREPAEKVFQEVQHAYDKVCEYFREKGAATG